jgi:hypothetical protein
MQESRRRRRLELGVLPLAAACLAACAQLRPTAVAPSEPVAVASSDGLRAQSAPVLVVATSGAQAGDAPTTSGLAAHPLSVAHPFVIQSHAVRALPELRLLRFGGLSPSPGPSDRLDRALPESESAADDNSEVDAEGVRAETDGQALGLGTGEAQSAELSELPRGTMVLHVGDSFAGALGVPLGKRLKAAGLRSVLQFKKASYIPTWAFGDELRINIKRYEPDLVLVSLGANEIELRLPMQRVYAIKRLVATLGSRPCVWISPPSWKPDAGLLAVIRENIAPCRYLDSDALVPYLPRGPDSIHPSPRGREMWADAVLDWLSRERDPGGQQPWQLRHGERLEPTADFQGGFPSRRAARP